MSVRSRREPAHVPPAPSSLQRVLGAGEAHRAEAATGVTVEGPYGPREMMLGLHLVDVGTTFLGKDDPQVIGVKKALAHAMHAQTASRKDRRKSVFHEGRFNFSVGDVAYQLSATYKPPDGQGSYAIMDLAMRAKTEKGWSRVFPLYVHDFKGWWSYEDSPWSQMTLQGTA